MTMAEVMGNQAIPGLNNPCHLLRPSSDPHQTAAVLEPESIPKISGEVVGCT